MDTFPIYPDLENRSVFISGGATGIGASIVKAFAEQKARVSFSDIEGRQGEALTKKLNDQGYNVCFYYCDITDCKKYQSVIEETATVSGPVSILINNAANDIRHSLSGLSSEQFDNLIAVNLKHAMFASQSVAPMMIKNGGGSIINFGSTGWMKGTSGYPVYAASKAATHGMTKGLARELGAHKIRVNTLAPGWVMTEKQKRLWVDDAAIDEISKGQCLPGDLLPEHIAQMALFLGSNASSMCSAQMFIVDGGWV
ncbi:MAG: SDR family NAD(P)-dependent oxidoreductase [Methyloligellaceae bacterium]